MGIYVGEIPELHWRHWEIQDTIRFNRHQRTLAVKQVNLWEIFSAVFKVIWECIGFASNCLVTSLENLHRAHKQSNASRKPIVTQSLGCSLGSISATLPCLVFAAPREERWVRVAEARAHIPEQRLVIEPTCCRALGKCGLHILLGSLWCSCVLTGACYCYGLSFIALAWKMFESFFILITASWVNDRKI